MPVGQVLATTAETPPRGVTRSKEAEHPALERQQRTVQLWGRSHITPRMGDLTVAEAKPERLQPFLNRVEKESGAGAAKNCRSTLSGMMALAVVNGAIEKNPVRQLERISRPKGKRRGSAAITTDELPTFLTRARADADLQKWDTELIDFMLSSGWRVAEACALDISSVDFAIGTATVEAINVRVKGKGVVRQDFPKTEKSARITPLPVKTVDLLRRRYERLGEFTTLLFSTPLMRPRDPSTTQREIRDRRDPSATPSCPPFVSQARRDDPRQGGLSATKIANYPGHENPSMTQDVYMNTLKGSTRAAEVMGLEGLI